METLLNIFEALKLQIPHWSICKISQACNSVADFLAKSSVNTDYSSNTFLFFVFGNSTLHVVAGLQLQREYLAICSVLRSIELIKLKK